MSRLVFWKNFSPVQRRAIVLVGVSLVVGFFLSRREGAIIARSNTAWRTIVAEKNPAFQVQMPVYPRHLVQDVVLKQLGITVKKGVFVSEDGNGRQYVLAVAEYPKYTPPFAPEKIVEAELGALFQSTSDYAIDVIPNANGADFSARRFDDGSSVRGRVLIDGQYVYVFSFSAPPSLSSDEYYQRFITSFQQ